MLYPTMNFAIHGSTGITDIISVHVLVAQEHTLFTLIGRNYLYKQLDFEVASILAHIIRCR